MVRHADLFRAQRRRRAGRERLAHATKLATRPGPAAWLRTVSFLRLTAALGLACAACGCTSGIAWRGVSYEPVAEVSRKENKLTFVYLRNWYDPTCTRFEDSVLSDPALRTATNPLNCVMLSYDYDQKLVEGWGVASAPAVLILSPSGEVLERCGGTATASDLIAAIRDARTRFGNGSVAATQPASQPTSQP